MVRFKRQLYHVLQGMRDDSLNKANMTDAPKRRDLNGVGTLIGQSSQYNHTGEYCM